MESLIIFFEKQINTTHICEVSQLEMDYMIGIFPYRTKDQ